MFVIILLTSFVTTLVISPWRLSAFAVCCRKLGAQKQGMHLLIVVDLSIFDRVLRPRLTLFKKDHTASKCVRRRPVVVQEIVELSSCWTKSENCHFAKFY